jgi:hypothetical protein
LRALGVRCSAAVSSLWITTVDVTYQGDILLHFGSHGGSWAWIAAINLGVRISPESITAFWIALEQIRAEFFSKFGSTISVLENMRDEIAP